MAGLYDLDIEAQVFDDLALGWDDPDFTLGDAVAVAQVVAAVVTTDQAIGVGGAIATAQDVVATVTAPNPSAFVSVTGVAQVVVVLASVESASATGTAIGTGIAVAPVVTIDQATGIGSAIAIPTDVVVTVTAPDATAVLGATGIASEVTLVALAPEASATGTANALGVAVTSIVVVDAASAIGGALAIVDSVASIITIPDASASVSAIATGAVVTAVVFAPQNASAIGTAMATGTAVQVAVITDGLVFSPIEQLDDLLVTAFAPVLDVQGDAVGTVQGVVVVGSAPDASAVGTAHTLGLAVAVIGVGGQALGTVMNPLGITGVTCIAPDATADGGDSVDAVAEVQDVFMVMTVPLLIGHQSSAPGAIEVVAVAPNLVVNNVYQLMTCVVTVKVPRLGEPIPSHLEVAVAIVEMEVVTQVAALGDLPIHTVGIDEGRDVVLLGSTISQAALQEVPTATVDEEDEVRVVSVGAMTGDVTIEGL